MDNQFATYEIAKSLKKLGFNKKCFGYYRNLLGSNEIIFSDSIKNNSKNNSELDNTKYNYIAAPLWQQVIDWLRDDHGIGIHEIEKKFTEEGCIFMVKPVGQYYIPERLSKEKAILKALELIEK